MFAMGMASSQLANLASKVANIESGVTDLPIALSTDN